jgi:hypothetical protein
MFVPVVSRVAPADRGVIEQNMHPHSADVAAYLKGRQQKLAAIVLAVL